MESVHVYHNLMNVVIRQSGEVKGSKLHIKTVISPNSYINFYVCTSFQTFILV